jgi:hypothetical protein
MDTEQTSQDSEPVEARLAAYFSATPEAAKPEPAQETEVAPQIEASDEQPEAAPEDDGNDDFDVDGTVYRIPKDLKAKVSEWKDAGMRTEDYTRKQQAAAEVVRQHQAQLEAFQIRQQFEERTKDKREELSKVKGDLDRYKQVDWSNLEVETYIKLKGQMDVLKERATELKSEIDKDADVTRSELTTRQKRTIEEGHQYLRKAIPGFGPTALEQAKEGARILGYSDAELDNVWDPRTIHGWYELAQYHKIKSGTAAAVASAQKAPPVVKPGASVPGAAADRKIKDARQSLKKSGSVDDFARVLIARGMT